MSHNLLIISFNALLDVLIACYVNKSISEIDESESRVILKGFFYTSTVVCVV